MVTHWTDWDVPEFFNFATDVVDHWADDPSLEAVIVADATGAVTRRTYADISRESKRLAAMMSDASIIPGDRIIVMLPRSSEWIVTMVACTRLGCVPIPCIRCSRPAIWRIESSTRVPEQWSPLRPMRPSSVDSKRSK